MEVNSNEKRFIEHVARWRQRAQLDAKTNQLISTLERLSSSDVDNDVLKSSLKEVIAEYLRHG